ncbi:SPW repeat domain-containing protein [Natrinema salifodinae]|uniref:SPW repeat-containing protein n=1 Tax=Natrinema salifodinae TaxID=1202768 RepID=A0A1I0NDW4_9EURY|nr:SPW repeat protein [Natrinema salifodinae]SEV99164.1 SPW repeat-containing protein [Natrinema salifodinae]
MSESTTDEPTTGESHARDRRDRAGQKWLSGFVSLIGFWLAAAPFVYEPAQSMLWNNLLVGGAIFLLAGYNYYRLSTGHSTSTGVMSLVALLALWTAVSQFAIGGQFAMDSVGVADTGLIWSNVVSGLVAAGLSAYIAYAAGRDVRTGTAAGTR